MTGAAAVRMLATAGLIAALAAGGCGTEPAPQPSTATPSTAASLVRSPASPATPEAADPSTLPEALTPGAGPEPAGIDWSDLENLVIDADGERIQLSGGTAVVSYGGASSDVFALQNRVAQGDLDDDGDDDLIVHVINRSAGTGVFHLLVPVIYDGGIAVPGLPVPLGDRVLVDEILIRDGIVEVTLYDRAEDEPFTVVTRRKTLEVDLSSPEAEVRSVRIETIEDLPLPGPELRDVDIRFEPGATSATVSGAIAFRQRQTYTVQASQGQPLTAVLAAPVGVWLDVRLGDLVLAAADERSQRVATALPSSGAWRFTVVSAHAGQSDYRLTVEALPLGSEQPSAPTTAVQAASEQALPTTPATTVPAPFPPLAGPHPVVHLTFDDGPHPTYTPQVLDILGGHGARATFFVLGSLAEAHPDLIGRMVAEGHTVANHTWNHASLAGMPRSSFDDAVGRTQAVLADRGTSCLRPPYGAVDAFTREWAASAGLDLVLWTVDTNDWRRPGAETIAQRIVRGAGDDAIILMHDGGGNRTQTVHALVLALDRLSGRGLRFEPVCI